MCKSTVDTSTINCRCDEPKPEYRSFDEWWFGTQFESGYWREHGHKHMIEYRWAKLAWDKQRGTIKELEAALSLTEALLQYEREKNTRAEKSLGEARKLTVGGREW